MSRGLLDAKFGAMSTITVDLRDEHMLQIRELAQEIGTTPEEWLRKRIEALLVDRTSDFERAAKYVLKKNHELYRRLA